MGGVLFLKPCAQKAFFPFLEESSLRCTPVPRTIHRPARSWTATTPRRSPSESARFANASGSLEKPDGYQPEQWMGEPQMQLFNLPS